jgi:hypothetical protein
MSTLTPVTKCPKCGGTTIELNAFANARENDMLTCPGCGHEAPKSEFVADILNMAAKMLQNALRDVPGFRPK